VVLGRGLLSRFVDLGEVFSPAGLHVSDGDLGEGPRTCSAISRRRCLAPLDLRRISVADGVERPPTRRAPGRWPRWCAAGHRSRGRARWAGRWRSRCSDPFGRFVRRGAGLAALFDVVTTCARREAVLRTYPAWVC